MKALLIGESASAIDQDAVVEALLSSARVTKLIHIRTLHLAPDELLVAVKVEFERDLSMADLARAVDGAEAAIRARVPAVSLIYIEPDLYRDTVS
jgi:divalent metal cation (Fe/Co/Zn/Cd) transporter